MKNTLRSILLSALIILSFSGGAHAFTIKGMTAGMSLDEIKKLFPSAAWKQRWEKLLVVEDGRFLYLTVGGSRVNSLAVMSYYTENAASEISIHIDCGIEPFNFIKLLSKQFGVPTETTGGPDSGIVSATWIANNTAMWLAYTPTSCYMLNLYDEAATKNFIEQRRYGKKIIKEMREGKQDDF